jgi:hypothetical protein
MIHPTAWNYTVHREKYIHGKHRIEGLPPFPGLVSKTEGNLGSTIPIPASNDDKDAAYNEALTRLNEKVRGGLDLSVALGEAGTTLRMLKATGKLLEHARRLKPPGGFGSTRDVANGYLQYKYGWKPLMSDIFKIADESIRVVVNNLQSIKAAAKIPKEGTSRVIYSSIHGVSNVPINRKLLKGSLSGCCIGVTLEVPTSSFQLNRWASLNPVSIAWELIPYSFVVDWFVDIGSSLRNVETACLYNTQFRAGFVSELWRYDCKDSIEGEFTRDAAPYRHYLSSLEGECQHIVFTRRTLSSYPFPRRPTFKVDLSSGQLLSAAALLRQLLPDAGQQQPPRRSRR